MYRFDIVFEKKLKDGTTKLCRLYKEFKTPKSAYTFARKIEERSSTLGRVEVCPYFWGVSSYDGRL